MLFEFIATITVGLGVAGIIMGVQKVLRGRLPKFAMPASAGIAMLLFTIWSEYSWYPRQLQALGPDAVVASTVDKQQFWRPWTFFAPVTTRFITIDVGKAQIKDDIVATDVIFVSRWQRGFIVQAAFDCRDNKRADLFEGFAEDLSAQLSEADWLDLPADDALLRKACGLM